MMVHTFMFFDQSKKPKGVRRCEQVCAGTSINLWQNTEVRENRNGSAPDPFSESEHKILYTALEYFDFEQKFWTETLQWLKSVYSYILMKINFSFKEN